MAGRRQRTRVERDVGRLGVATALALLLLSALASCSAKRLGFRDDEATADGAANAPATLHDGGALADGSLLGYCAGNGPPVIVTDTGAAQQSRCTGEIAQVAFRFALCTCEPFSSIGELSTDAFDHKEGPYDAQKAGGGAAAGFNGALNTTGPARIGGPLQIGDGGATLLGETSVGGALQCRGDVKHWLGLDIAADAAVDGNVSGTGTLKVAGTLTQPAGKTVSSLLQQVGKKAQAPLTIAAPCDCAPEHLLDVAKLVATYAQANDNAAAHFDAAALDGFLAEKTLDVPCGRLYLRKIAGSGTTTLRVTGRAALFVGGDVSIAGGLAVELATPQAELDLFIEGGFASVGALNLGDGTAPSRVRIYIGGSQRIDLTGASTLGGNLYAPRAELNVAGSLEVFGSLFVRKLSTAGGTSVHYDRAVLDAGSDCPPPAGGGSGKGPSCASCRDCGNQACVASRWGACTQDSDCCAPLRCAQGTCVAPIL